MVKIENYNPAEIEAEILKFWEKNRIYSRLKDKNKGKKPFYYLDGPPYTSGKIHTGHAWGKALRDSAMRYKRAAGFDVWDRSGFDMHGLPISHKVEEKLKIKGKDEIEKYGVKKFIEECKKLATENMHHMIKDFQRIGVWMDFDNPYKPIDNSYIEGIWWLIKKAHENKRLYEGFRTLTWCSNCETATAKHELEYENITDDSIFVKFKVSDTNAQKSKISGTTNRGDEYLIIWTTTPWTIPFNLAVMVNPDLDYLKVKVEGETWTVAKALAAVFIQGLLGKKFEVIEEFKGEALEGVRYEHPFSGFIDYPKAEKVHTVLMSSQYVDTTSGSGLVHCAPGCGAEDYEVGYQNGLPAFNLLDERGIFHGIKKFDGLQAKVDDRKFIKELEKVGALVESTPVEHDYPHCWRCHNPVVFRATKQWFFKVEDLKEEMKKKNKKIHWVPDWAGSRQFHSWLDNLRDNSITKQIHWGTPFPVWKCEKCEDYTVVGSVKELGKLAGAKNIPKDLHKPYIDEVKIRCKCGGMQKKNPDVLDVWVDAGCASWLCLDYPVRTDLFKKLFPADFILEGKDQIRGWFNLLLVASMVSMGKHSFDAVYMHGFINDAQGRKMSKSLGNVISPYEIIEKYGSDTLRYYMIGGSNPGVDINYNFDDTKIKNKNLIILWNLHKYLIDASDISGINPAKIPKVKFDTEEKYMLSKLNSTIKRMTETYDRYGLNETPWIVEELFLELSRTYIQLVREKLAAGEDDEKKAVLYTIYHTLLETVTMFTPIAPFISEKIFQNFREAFGLKEESVSFSSWPKANDKKIDKKLEQDFEKAKDAIQSILNAREKANLGVRWPVKEATVATKDENVKKAVSHLENLIKVQTNVKKISVTDKFKGVEKVVKPDYKTLGPAFGGLAPKIISNISEESPEMILKHIDKDGFKMKVEGADIVIKKEHIVVETRVGEGFTYSEFPKGEVFLDNTRTPELEEEGYFREISRRVQNLRKNAGLHKSDRIKAFIEAGDGLMTGLKKFESELKQKIGAKVLRIENEKPEEKFDVHQTEKIKGETVKIWFSKV